MKTKITLIVICLFVILASSCNKPNHSGQTLEIINVEHITHATAILTFEIVDDGGYFSPNAWVYVSEKSGAIENGDKIEFGITDTNPLVTYPLVQLKPGTDYYIVVSTDNNIAVAYTDEFHFKTKPVNFFTDGRDGNVYPEIVIGEQTWMGENLRFEIEGKSKEIISEWYETGPEYGLLYPYEVAEQACPAGWRLPGDDDWKQLERFLGMPEEEIDLDFVRGENIIQQLIIPGRKYWESSFDSITNSTGFSAIGTGAIHDMEENNWVNKVTYFWSSTNLEDHAAVRRLGNTHSGIYRWLVDVEVQDNRFYSIRCIKE
jgi:uncharacterized protein (TIGR02145 family)